MKRWLVLTSVFWISGQLLAQENKLLRSGNELYDEGEFEKAGEHYQKAIDANEESFKAYFNLGDALYEQKKDSLAIDHFKQAVTRAVNKNDRADAQYNLGNIALRQKKWQEAIDYYKQSLMNHAGNHKAQYNLSLAMKRLKLEKEHSKSQNKEKKGQNSPPQKKQPKPDQNQQENEGSNKNDQQQNQDQQNPEEKPSDQQPGEKATETLSRNDVKKLLEAARQREQEVQQRLMYRKLKQKPNKSDKDW